MSEFNDAALKAAIDAYAQRLITDAAATAQEVAQREVAVDTGHLRRSIEIYSVPGEAGIQTNVDYALDQEFGTKLQPGKPYLRPAFEAAKKYVERKIS